MPKRQKATLKTKQDYTMLGNIPTKFQPEWKLVGLVEYVPGRRQLTVTLLTNTRDAQGNPAVVRQGYRYENVPPELYVDFYRAESAGKFFGEHIRPMFTGVKV